MVSIRMLSCLFRKSMMHFVWLRFVTRELVDLFLKSQHQASIRQTLRSKASLPSEDRIARRFGFRESIYFPQNAYHISECVSFIVFMYGDDSVENTKFSGGVLRKSHLRKREKILVRTLRILLAYLKNIIPKERFFFCSRSFISHPRQILTKSWSS